LPGIASYPRDVIRPMRAPLMRATAALAVLVLVGSTLLVGWHRASVAHGVCAEHGEELHLRRIGQRDATQVPADGATRIGASTWELRDGDHHCAVAATTRDPATAGADAPALVAVVEPDDAPALPVDPTGATAVLYHLAPKTSPPA